MNVLIADDSDTIRTCIRDMLKDVPHVNVVGEASSTSEAVERIEAENPDVAILDIRMPGGGGLEVLKTVRAKGISPVAIMLTNYPYPEYRRKCMEAGAEFFFDKSSEFDRLPGVLKMLMEGGDVRESSRHVAFEQLVSMSEETQRLADVEQRNQATEAQLRRRGAIMHAVGYAADRFLQTRSWRDNAADVLEHLGRASESSRVTLFKVDTNDSGTSVAAPLHAWVDAGLLTQLDAAEHEQEQVCPACMADWQAALSAGEVVQRLASTCDPGELVHFSRDQVLSTVAIPVFVEDKWWGVMSFEECRVERQWSSEEIEALRAAASTLGAAIGREGIEERVRGMVEERTRELRDAQAQLVRQEKETVLGQLANGVGHELRNPLGVISNAVDFLRTIQPDAPDKVREYHDIISAEVSNAKRIVSQLLIFSRIKTTNPGKISVRSLVGKLIEKVPPPGGITVDTDIAADLPAVVADLDHLNQILSNLVINAYQAMPRGGELTIEAVRNSEEEVSLTVRDTGEGISPDNLDKIFEPTFTTKARGIGLGLTLSRNLAKTNGCRIEVDSKEGEGAAFTVFLPVAGHSAQE